MIRRTSPTQITLLTLLALAGTLGADKQRQQSRPDPHERAIHLPGIAGAMRLDRYFVQGLRDGGYPGDIDIYDWTAGDPGLRALVSRERNEREAEKVALNIATILKDDPNARIRIVCHSGGAGIAAWALERLPEGAKIETLIMLAPALSQRYDLSKALAHVRGKAYALTSVNDVLVLGAGTRMFGTIDGLKEEAAGLRGFTMPDEADAKQYEKLVQMPYDEAWMALDNIGDHVGPMGYTFARRVVAYLLQGRTPPPLSTTRPVRQTKTAGHTEPPKKAAGNSAAKPEPVTR